ncbi:MAG TPA: SLC13 family permease [Terriglobia bacterium]|nr:SLC13 family permease [Terriglobia bacterium]
MNLGLITLGALALAVILSCTTSLNVGLLAIALAWFIGVYLGHMPVRDIAGGFPVDLFLTLAGVTLLFSQARVNGTLERVAHQAVRLCKGRVGLVPIMYFLLGAGLATSGPGNIATTGLLAPMAMTTAMRMGISPFLMAIMVGNGANSGSLSPLAPTGIIVSGLMNRIGLPGLGLQTWFFNFIAHALVAFAGYLVFGGWKLLTRSDRLESANVQTEPLDRRHVLTIAMIALLIAGVFILKVNIGMAAFAAAVILGLLGAADQEQAIKEMPWGSIMMVCGVTVLIALLEKTSGMGLFTSLLTRISSRATIIPFLAVIVGTISAYSSTSGVVLPAFLPLVPKLSESLGGGMAKALAMTMNVSGHLVDVSPLSTIGALCIASIPAGVGSRRLFNQLLAWGLSMTVIGALICWAFFG